MLSCHCSELVRPSNNMFPSFTLRRESEQTQFSFRDIDIPAGQHVAKKCTCASCHDASNEGWNVDRDRNKLEVITLPALLGELCVRSRRFDKLGVFFGTESGKLLGARVQR